MNNEVIIIGGDHHNTLAVLRNLGKHKIKFTVVIHSSNNTLNEELMISHSKYAKNIVIVKDNEESIVGWLLNHNFSSKQIVIPTSDLAEYVLDNNYDKLASNYFIPGFKNNPGKVVLLMDKYKQKEWACNHNILMAKSWLIKKNNFDKIDSIVYPCIVKPNISASGKKGDITICNNKLKLQECLNKMFSQYEELIVQEFIDKKYELLAMGYISDLGYDSYGIERKIRETIPGGGGSTALGQFIVDQSIINEINKTITALFKEGYRGLFDIEFFECNNGIYLNEINFRHSGAGFALIKNGIEVPYIYYLDCLNKKHKNKYKLKRKKGYFFCDIGEYHLYRKYKTINFFQFIYDFSKSYAHSIFDIKDLGVIKYVIKKVVKK